MGAEARRRRSGDRPQNAGGELIGQRAQQGLRLPRLSSPRPSGGTAPCAGSPAARPCLAIENKGDGGCAAEQRSSGGAAHEWRCTGGPAVRSPAGARARVQAHPTTGRQAGGQAGEGVLKKKAIHRTRQFAHLEGDVGDVAQLGPLACRQNNNKKLCISGWSVGATGQRGARALARSSEHQASSAAQPALTLGDRELLLLLGLHRQPLHLQPVEHTDRCSGRQRAVG